MSSTCTSTSVKWVGHGREFARVAHAVAGLTRRIAVTLTDKRCTRSADSGKRRGARLRTGKLRNDAVVFGKFMAGSQGQQRLPLFVIVTAVNGVGGRGRCAPGAPASLLLGHRA
jgi:hypothetical protein